MAPLLAGKVAVITGAASKMGQTIARRFVDHGAKVLLTDVQFFDCQNIAQTINNNNTTTSEIMAKAMKCDVTQPSEIQEAIEQAKKTFCKDLDIFYNNAAVKMDVSPIGINILKNTMGVNFTSVLEIIEQAGNAMRKNKSGCILCTGSTMGPLVDAVPSAHSISKAAVVGVIRAAAADLASHGVRVNAISPHFVAPRLDIDTNLLKEIIPFTTTPQLEDMIKHYKTSRPVSEDDVANAAVYLASNASKSVTGLNLVLDGKFTV